nr:hypothetical protein [Pseudoalteromonas piscicida]
MDQDVMPEWSIFEILMLADPDFDNVKALSERIHGVFAELSEEIFTTLKVYQ